MKLNALVFVLSMAAGIQSAAALELPPNVAAKLDPKIVKVLSSDPSMAAAAVIPGSAFSYGWGLDGSDGALGQDKQVELHPISALGLFEETIVYKEDDGYVRKSQAVTALGGLLPLIERSETTNPDGSQFSTDTVLIDVEIEGDIFPMKVGNDFSVAWEKKIGSEAGNTLAATLECDVKSEGPAKDFLTGLTGTAFHVYCEMDLPDGVVAEEDFFYFADVGYFVPDYRMGKADGARRYAVTFQP